jgi:hypothetical protein
MLIPMPGRAEFEEKDFADIVTHKETEEGYENENPLPARRRRFRSDYTRRLQRHQERYYSSCRISESSSGRIPDGIFA